MWAAYLAKYQGWSVTEAYARGEAIGIGRTPYSKYLDLELEMVEKKD